MVVRTRFFDPHLGQCLQGFAEPFFHHVAASDCFPELHPFSASPRSRNRTALAARLPASGTGGIGVQTSEPQRYRYRRTATGPPDALFPAECCGRCTAQSPPAKRTPRSRGSGPCGPSERRRVSRQRKTASHRCGCRCLCRNRQPRSWRIALWRIGEESWGFTRGRGLPETDALRLSRNTVPQSQSQWLFGQGLWRIEALSRFPCMGLGRFQAQSPQAN